MGEQLFLRVSRTSWLLRPAAGSLLMRRGLISMVAEQRCAVHSTRQQDTSRVLADPYVPRENEAPEAESVNELVRKGDAS